MYWVLGFLFWSIWSSFGMIVVFGFSFLVILEFVIVIRFDDCLISFWNLLKFFLFVLRRRCLLLKRVIMWDFEGSLFMLLKVLGLIVMLWFWNFWVRCWRSVGVLLFEWRIWIVFFLEIGNFFGGIVERMMDVVLWGLGKLFKIIFSFWNLVFLRVLF